MQLDASPVSRRDRAALFRYRILAKYILRGGVELFDAIKDDRRHVVLRTSAFFSTYYHGMPHGVAVTLANVILEILKDPNDRAKCQYNGAEFDRNIYEYRIPVAIIDRVVCVLDQPTAQYRVDEQTSLLVGKRGDAPVLILKRKYAGELRYDPFGPHMARLVAVAILQLTQEQNN